MGLINESQINPIDTDDRLTMRDAFHEANRRIFRSSDNYANPK